MKTDLKNFHARLYNSKGNIDKINSILKENKLFFDKGVAYADGNRIYLDFGKTVQSYPYREVDPLLFSAIDLFRNKKWNESHIEFISFAHNLLATLYPETRTNPPGERLLSLVFKFGVKLNFSKQIDCPDSYDTFNLYTIRGPGYRFWSSNMDLKSFQNVLLACGDLPKTPEEALSLSLKEKKSREFA